MEKNSMKLLNYAAKRLIFSLALLASLLASAQQQSDSVSRDNSTLIDTSTCLLNGLCNVNETNAHRGYANMLQTGVYSLSAQELTQEIHASQLAQNFLNNTSLVKSTVWTPETQVVATKLLASSVKPRPLIDPLDNDKDWQRGMLVDTWNDTTQEWALTLAVDDELQHPTAPACCGVMRFKYRIADADGLPVPFTSRPGSTTPFEMRGQVIVKPPEMPTAGCLPIGAISTQ
jgi:hypothetical protein